MNNEQSDFIAAIDIGTNSFHLCIAKIHAYDFKIIHRDRIVLRLREKSDSDSHIIASNKLEEAIQVLTQFKKTSELYGAKIVAVATSAIREAENKIEIIRQIKDRTGINVNIISGDEEASLAFKTVRYATQSSERDFLIFDLGGGSTEIIIVKENKIVFQESLKIGAVRFTQKYFTDLVITEHGISSCRLELRDLLNIIHEPVQKYSPKKVFGIGGTITAIGWLIEKNIGGKEHNFESMKNYKITLSLFETIRDLILNSKTVDERKLISGLDPKRADIIPAGMLIIDEFYRHFNVNEIILLGYGLREGIIINEIEKRNIKPLVT